MDDFIYNLPDYALILFISVGSWLALDNLPIQFFMGL